MATIGGRRPVSCSANAANVSGSLAVYVSFGQAIGYVMPSMGTGYQLLDLNGAGAQRADLKTGDPKKYPNGYGPQRDQVRVLNYARCVRDI